MSFFTGNPLFVAVFQFLTSITIKSLVICVMTSSDKIKMYGNPQEGINLIEEAIKRTKKINSGRLFGK